MAQAKSGASDDAATKIQAAVRGKQDRRRVESHLTNVIDAMQTGKEPPPFPSHSRPKSAQSFYTSDGDHSVDDETSVEEEVIVVIDDSYSDHTREEVLAEFVTYSEENPLPSPPRPKSAFERYNDQLKASLAKPKKAPVIVEKMPPVSVDEGLEPGDTEDPPINPGGWRGKFKKKLSWKSSKIKPEKEEPKPSVAPEDSMASVMQPTKGNSAPQKTSKSSIYTDGDGDSLKNKIELAESKLGGSKIVPGTTEDTAALSPAVEKPMTERSPVLLPKALTKKEAPESPTAETDDAPVPDGSEEENPRAKRRSVVLSRWPPPVPGNTHELAPDDKQKAKRSPVALPRWVTKTELPPTAPDLSDEVDETTAVESSAPEVEKPVVKRNKVVLPKWLQPADPTDTEVSEDKPAPSIRRWKRPEPKVEPPPVKSSETLEATPASTSEEKDAKAASPPVESPEALQSMPSQEATADTIEAPKEEPKLEDHSSDHNQKKLSIPRMKPTTSESPERDPSPPRPRSPHATRSSLANRYLSSVSKADTSEHERIAQIEADRARGRWDGKAYVRGDGDGGDGAKERKNWKFLKGNEKEEEVDEGPVIKIQAIARGFLARQRVAKYVDSLIEEAMLKLASYQADEESRRREKQEKARLLLEEEEYRLWQEREEERLKNEEEAIKRRMYDERYGLPQWWMETIPHKTMSQKEYKAMVKKDNGETVIDYKLPPRARKSLAVLTEEESENDDENNSNISNYVSAKKPSTKPKKKSALGCMGDDAVELVESSPNVDYDVNDKKDTKRKPDSLQESAPPAATKIWM